MALGIDFQGNKMSLGFWQGVTENAEICAELLSDLERRGFQVSHSKMMQRWLASVLLHSEQNFRRIKGHESIEQVMQRITIAQEGETTPLEIRKTA